MLKIFLTISALCIIFISSEKVHFYDFIDPFEKKYSPLPEWKRLEALEKSKEMFYFGYENYITFAFPQDELDPIHCTGRGPDYQNPSNLNINDVLGDFALTLIESLDTLAIMGDIKKFREAVKLVIENVSFNKPSTVQVFEANIRVLGSLLSAHLLSIDPSHPFGKLTSPAYNNELLHLAKDLGHRLIKAFQLTETGIPHPRVNLRAGIPKNSINETCTAGAGTLRLEFGVLSRLLGDPSFEIAAKLTSNLLWERRSNITGLFGNVINIQTGKWEGHMSGLGAGIDSYFEYLFKSFILFGDSDDLNKFNEAVKNVKKYLRKGRKDCNKGNGHPPIFVNVNMNTGKLDNNWIDSLQAAWSSVQVLVGDIEEAICSHAFYYSLWLKYDALPERYNWLYHQSEVSFYPLRPEFIESTYFLYRATKNPFYLHVGLKVMNSIEKYNKAQCGYATRHDVNNFELEDRMESFFLSETCKYLYLLFDEHNHVNKHSDKYIFTTEGHILPLLPLFQQPIPHHVFTPPKDPYSCHIQQKTSQNHNKTKKKKTLNKNNKFDETESKALQKYVNLNREIKLTGEILQHIDGRNNDTISKFFTDFKLMKSGFIDFFTGLIHGWKSEEYLNLMKIDNSSFNTTFLNNCQKQSDSLRFNLPIKPIYLRQIQQIIGV